MAAFKGALREGLGGTDTESLIFINVKEKLSLLITHKEKDQNRFRDLRCIVKEEKRMKEKMRETKKISLVIKKKLKTLI